MTMRILFWLTLACVSRPAPAEEPWSAAPAHPAWEQPAAPAADTPARSASEWVARGWLAFYRQWLGVVTQSRCRMLPSCSTYSLQCIERHGVLAGVVMTADRLLHEGDEQALNRFVKTAGISYCPDPVSNNDFWWASHE